MIFLSELEKLQFEKTLLNGQNVLIFENNTVKI